MEEEVRETGGTETWSEAMAHWRVAPVMPGPFFGTGGPLLPDCIATTKNTGSTPVWVVGYDPWLR